MFVSLSVGGKNKLESCSQTRFLMPLGIPLKISNNIPIVSGAHPKGNSCCGHEPIRPDEGSKPSAFEFLHDG